MNPKRYSFKEGLQALVKDEGLHFLYRQTTKEDSYAVCYSFDYEEGSFMERKCVRLPSGELGYSPKVPAKFDPQVKEEGFVLDTVIPLANPLAFDQVIEKLMGGVELTVFSNVSRAPKSTHSLKGFIAETNYCDLTITRDTFNNYKFYGFS